MSQQIVEQCGRCGRDLKDKKSIERGYGPKCYQKVKAAPIDETNEQLSWDLDKDPDQT